MSKKQYSMNHRKGKCRPVPQQPSMSHFIRSKTGSELSKKIREQKGK